MEVAQAKIGERKTAMLEKVFLYLMGGVFFLLFIVLTAGYS